MNSVTITLNNTCNPFADDAPAGLVNISSGKAANEGTKKFLLGTWSRGGSRDSNLKMNAQLMDHGF